MVTGEAAGEAVAIARSRPRLAVGLHLVLVSGAAASPPVAIASLVDARGRFPESPVRAGLRYQFSRRARAELRAEIRAQLDRFRDTGLPLSHVDGHLHLHVHPVVIGLLAEAAGEYSIPAVRLPREELRASLALDRSAWATKLAWAAIFGSLRRRAAPRLAAAGVDVADRVYGLFQTGRIDERYLLGLLPRIRGERVEIYAHPGVEIAGEPSNGPPGSGGAELAALTSPRVRAAIEASGYRLTTPRGLFSVPEPVPSSAAAH
jgi:hopanoid biosynthesis associated protein HpnK